MSDRESARSQADALLQTCQHNGLGPEDVGRKLRYELIMLYLRIATLSAEVSNLQGQLRTRVRGGIEVGYDDPNGDDVA